MKTVLLVEDSGDDILLMGQACQQAHVPHNFKFVMDGQAAIDYMSGIKGYGNRLVHPLPDLVFLDVNLPKRNGHEVLEWVRAQPGFKNLPVIMLTGSDEPCDIERAYRLGVTSYFTKKANLDEFNEGVRISLKYWLELNVNPPAQHFQAASPSRVLAAGLV